MILGAIDIGSNAARLLIAEAAPYKDGTVDYTKLTLLRIPLRLGMDVFNKGYIDADRHAMLLETMKAYSHLINIFKVQKLRACATSAMRDAANSQIIIEEVKEQTGIQIEIISGDEEANVLYEMHVAENLGSNKSYLYIDVGGGSTELTLFAKGELVHKQSFNIGTIRMLQGKVSEDTWEQLKTFINTKIAKYQPVEAIGTGGNINKIFSMSGKKEGKPLPLELIQDYYQQMSSSTVEERMHLYNFRSDRADVIVPALQIYLNVMTWADAHEVFVPKFGLADGLVRMMYRDSVGE